MDIFLAGGPDATILSISTFSKPAIQTNLALFEYKSDSASLQLCKPTENFVPVMSAFFFFQVPDLFVIWY